MPSALKVLTGPLQPRVLLLPERCEPPYVLGRSLESNLILAGPAVAERHALLVGEAGDHRIVPGSRGRTWVEGEAITEARPLAHGDRIRIGNHTLLYQRAQDPPPGPSETPCAACGALLGPSSGTGPALRSLHLGDELICPRCVDGRLHLERQLDSYRILRKITNNDEEVTYLAVDTRSLDRVAVRILRAERQADARVLRRFLVRALVGVVLDHPNFLPVRGVHVSAGIPFVVVEHVERSTKLEVLVREGGAAHLADALYVTNQLAEILRHAREQELVVAKRKKSGVLIDPSGWVKVLAYDVTLELERRVAETEAFADLASQAGERTERLRAASYEPRDDDEARLGRLADEFAEVYSVGRILFQMVSGTTFGAGSLEAVRKARRALRKGKELSGGPLAGQPAAIVSLIERVIVPKGPERIRTLDGFTSASKETFRRMVEEGDLPSPG